MIVSDQLSLSRVSGTQNTFFIVNTLSGDWKEIYPGLSKEQKQKIARKLCGSFYGFKTDGLLFLHAQKDFDFAWDFFNSDGSFAEMCGNASRCASMYFYQKIKAKKNLSFFSGAGDIGAEIIDDYNVKITMPKISPIQKMSVLGIEGLFVDTGVPHFVFEKHPDRELAKKLRQVSDFGKAGSNITFVENLGNAFIKAVTFERGVEDYTQACGTGAVAAALYYQDRKSAEKIVSVEMPGGLLKVENASSGFRPFLIGPVEMEFDLGIAKKEIVGEG